MRTDHRDSTPEWPSHVFRLRGRRKLRRPSVAIVAGGLAVAITVAIVLAVPGVLIGSAGGDPDWPQWRGTTRSGYAPLQDRVENWSGEEWPDRLELEWRVGVDGGGYSSPLVRGGRVYLHQRRGGAEALVAYSLRSGDELFRREEPSAFTPNRYATEHGRGPNATPLMAGSRIVTVGINGDVRCYDSRTGDPLWSSLPERAPSTEGLFSGNSVSPISHEGRVFVYRGDDGGGEILALDLENGEIAWRWEGPGPGYAAPVLAPFEGSVHLIFLSQESAFALAAENGRWLWSWPLEDEWNENIVTPVVFEDLLILSGVRQGTFALRVDRLQGHWQPREVWRLEGVPMYMSSPVLAAAPDGRDSLLVGLSSRNKGQLVVLDPRNGEILGRGEARFTEHASLLATRRRILVFTEEAELGVFELSPSGDSLSLLRTYPLGNGRSWSHPAVVDGARILVRDADSLALYRIPGTFTLARPLDDPS